MKPSKRKYEPKLSLYPLSFEDAVKTLGKAKPEPKKAKSVDLGAKAKGR